MGSTPATKEKATASGISANETVKPDKISFFGFFVKFNENDLTT